MLSTQDPIKQISNASTDLINTNTLQSKNNINIKGYVNSNNTLITPIGFIIAYAGNAPPKNWLICNGQSCESYPLSKIIGPNVPNLTNRVILGSGTKPINTIGGNDTHTLTIDELPKHKHTLTSNGSHAHYYQSENGGQKEGGGSWQMHRDQSGSIPTDQYTHTHTVSSVGSGGSHNNMQPYCIVNYIIRAA